MKAFHGDAAVKEEYLARLRAHHAADEIIQGTGWENGHGCAVGCTLNQYNHSAYESELGLPRWLAHLEDRIFEGLPAKDAQQFAVDFLEAVPVGADVSKVRFQLAALRHRRQLVALTDNREEYAIQVRAALEQVIAYCEYQGRTEEMRSAAWSAAWSAWSAWSAESAESAESAAWSAWSAESAAWSAESAESAESAAWSAESAAWSAESAESAAWSAESAAESAESAAEHFKWEAANLLELLPAVAQAA